MAMLLLFLNKNSDKVPSCGFENNLSSELVVNLLITIKIKFPQMYTLIVYIWERDFASLTMKFKLCILFARYEKCHH